MLFIVDYRTVSWRVRRNKSWFEN